MVGVVLWQKAASADVPTSVVCSTIKAGSLFAVGQAAGLISAKVAALTTEVLRAMLLTQLRFDCVVLVIGGIMCAGTSVSTHFLSAQANATEQAGRTTSKRSEKHEAKTKRAANATVEQDRERATRHS